MMNFRDSLLMQNFKNEQNEEESLFGKDISTNNNIINPVSNFESTNIYSRSMTEDNYCCSNINIKKEDDDDFSVLIFEDYSHSSTEKEVNQDCQKHITNKRASQDIKKMESNIKKVNVLSKIEGGKNNKNDKEKRKDNDQNKLTVLNNCFNELNDLISKYSFIEISKIIIKIMNDINEENKKKNKLYEKVKDVISKIGNKKSIVMICLSIWSRKLVLKTNKDKIDDIYSQQKKIEQNKKEEIPYLNRKNIAEKPDIQNSIKINDNLYFFDYSCNIILLKLLLKVTKLGSHYYKNNEEIFSYNTNNKNIPFTFLCSKYGIKCRAKCIIDNNCSIKLLNTHNHNEGIMKSGFYKRYPFLIGKKWEHIQIFKIKDKVFVIRLC